MIDAPGKQRAWSLWGAYVELWEAGHIVIKGRDWRQSCMGLRPQMNAKCQVSRE